MLFYCIDGRPPSPARYTIPAQPGDNTVWPERCLRLAFRKRDPVDVVFGPEELARGMLNFGDSSRFEPVRKKLAHGQCLNVIVLGGSLTAGVGVLDDNDHRAPREFSDCLASYKNYLYPSIFKAHLDRRFPCDDAAGHVVENLGRPAVSSDYWVSVAATWRANPPFNATDLVIVDTALNDIVISDLHHETALFDATLEQRVDPPRHNAVPLPVGAERVYMYTELLVLLLRTLQPEPALLWLGTSTIGPPPVAPTPDQRADDAVKLHLPITRYHGVTHFGMMDALGPFLSPAQVDFFYNQWRVENSTGHCTFLGHRVIGTAVLRVIELMARIDAREPMESRPPLACSQGVVDMYMRSTPQIVPVATRHDSFLRNSSGCSLREDRPGKPGLICEAVGDSAMWTVDDTAFITRGEMKVGHMKSYVGMGTLRIQVVCGNVTVADELLDALHTEHASVVEMDTVSFAHERDRCRASGPLKISATVAESLPPRISNKVKIIIYVII